VARRPKGDLRVTYDNLERTSSALITADFRSNALLDQIIAQRPLLQISGVTFGYIRGSWTSDVTFVD
jgi:hypothetical protein